MDIDQADKTRPWCGEITCDLRKEALLSMSNGVPLIDEQNTVWAVVFPNSTGNYDHVPAIVDAINLIRTHGS